MTIPHIDFNLIFSDPLLSIGALLVLLGVLFFLFSAYKFLTYKGSHREEFIVPIHEKEEPLVSPTPIEETPLAAVESESPAEAPVMEKSSRRERVASDETMVLPAGVSDVQAQLEIAISQIKQLNKRINELERAVESVQDRHDTKLEPNELKEPPMDAGDFTKKLLKVVEHLLVLEREMARLRAKKDVEADNAPSPTATPPESFSPSGGIKPPVMPL